MTDTTEYGVPTTSTPAMPRRHHPLRPSDIRGVIGDLPGGAFGGYAGEKAAEAACKAA
jgi:hypothetical protein